MIATARLVVPALVLSLGCSQEAQLLQPDRASYPPGALAIFRLPEGAASLRAAKYEASLGAGASVAMHTLDALSLVMVVPSLPVGQHELSVDLDGTAFRTALQIVAPSTVTPPAQHLDQVSQTFGAELDALVATDDAAEALKEGAAELKAALQAEVARLASVGGKEAERAAQFFAANPELASPDLFDDAGPAMPLAAAVAPGFLTCSHVTTPEARIKCIESRLYRRVALLAVSVVALASMPAVAALVAAVHVYKLNDWLQREANAQLVQVGDLIVSALETPARLLRPEVAAPLTVRSGEENRFHLVSEYRPLGADDAASAEPVVARLVSSLTQLKVIWVRLESALPFGLRGTAVQLETLCAPQQSSPVAGAFVTAQVLEISSGASLSVDIADGALTLHATLPAGVDRAEAALRLRYENPEVSRSETVLAVEITGGCGAAVGGAEAAYFGVSIGDQCWLNQDWAGAAEMRWSDGMQACPPGWRLASDSEWMELERFVGLMEEQLTRTGPRGHPAGYALLEGGATGFNAVLGEDDSLLTCWMTSTIAPELGRDLHGNTTELFYGRCLSSGSGDIHRVYLDKDNLGSSPPARARVRCLAN